MVAPAQHSVWPRDRGSVLWEGAELVRSCSSFKDTDLLWKVFVFLINLSWPWNLWIYIIFFSNVIFKRSLTFLGMGSPQNFLPLFIYEFFLSLDLSHVTQNSKCFFFHSTILRVERVIYISFVLIYSYDYKDELGDVLP